VKWICLVGSKDITTGRDITNAVINCAEAHHIDLKNLIGITTDGATSMVRKNTGAVNLIMEHVKALRKSAQVLNMLHVMSVIVRVSNSILEIEGGNSNFHKQK